MFLELNAILNKTFFRILYDQTNSFYRNQIYLNGGGGLFCSVLRGSTVSNIFESKDNFYFIFSITSSHFILHMTRIEPNIFH
jgi:hypothetical protein